MHKYSNQNFIGRVSVISVSQLLVTTSKKYQPLNLADITDDIPSDSATARLPGSQTACAGVEIRSLKVKMAVTRGVW